jgi:hypothetical protein
MGEPPPGYGAGKSAGLPVVGWLLADVLDTYYISAKIRAYASSVGGERGSRIAAQPRRRRRPGRRPFLAAASGAAVQGGGVAAAGRAGPLLPAMQ